MIINRYIKRKPHNNTKQTIKQELAEGSKAAEALHASKPPEMPPPTVVKVVGRAYRDSDSAVSGEVPWLGYAFVLFRDREEAEEALRAFGGRTLAGGWTVDARWQGEPLVYHYLSNATQVFFKSGESHNSNLW